MRCAVAVVLLAACDRVLGLTPVPDGARRDTADGTPDAVPACASVPTVADTFDAFPLCGDWGTLESTATSMTINGGELLITPTLQQPGFGGCLAKLAVPFTATGVFVEVPTVGFGPSEYTVLIAHDGVYDTTINAATDFIALSATGEEGFMLPYVASAMRWWRIRTTPARDAIIGEYSGDGMVWTQLGSFMVHAPEMVTTNIGHGASNPEDVVFTTHFGSFNICP